LAETVLFLKSCAAAVGAALCRERAAQRPRQYLRRSWERGAAARPFRDTRPLPQLIAYSKNTVESRTI